MGISETTLNTMNTTFGGWFCHRGDSSPKCPRLPLESDKFGTSTGQTWIFSKGTYSTKNYITASTRDKVTKLEIQDEVT